MDDDKVVIVIARCPNEWCSMHRVTTANKAACGRCGIPFLPGDRQSVCEEERR